MTKEEILVMKPGRKLDALVAKEIFNIESEWDYSPWDIGKQLPKQPFRKGEPRTCLGPMAHSVANTIFDYSTDITAAWQVVEKMRSMEDSEGNPLLCCLTIYSDHDIVWDIRWCYSEFSNRNDGHKTHHLPTSYDDFPEAICKAALLTKVEVN